MREIEVSRGEPPEVLVKHIEAFLLAPDDCSVELVQCAVHAKREVVWALGQVTAAEAEVGRLAWEMVVASTRASEARAVRQRWVDVAAYAESSLELSREQYGFEE